MIPGSSRTFCPDCFPWNHDEAEFFAKVVKFILSTVKGSILKRYSIICASSWGKVDNNSIRLKPNYFVEKGTEKSTNDPGPCTHFILFCQLRIIFTFWGCATMAQPPKWRQGPALRPWNPGPRPKTLHFPSF